MKDNKKKFLFAFFYAVVVSMSENIFLIALEFLIAAVFFKKDFIKFLLRLNIINFIVIISLALTWPDVRGGFFTGILIALRVNMIYIIFAALVFPMGFSGVYEVLLFLKVPEKLRILILLTFRGIFILKERFDAALISLKLRAPKMKIKSFTYVTGSVLLQAADRSEKIERAIKCRGGFEGFNSGRS